MIVSTKQLANFLDLSARRVQALENDGILKKENKNEWDLKKCFLDYLEYKLSVANETFGLTEARAKKEKADAEIKELALAEKKQEVVSVEKIEKDLSDIAITLSNQLYNLPQKIKRDIALSEDVENCINRNIDELLHELKNASLYTKYCD